MERNLICPCGLTCCDCLFYKKEIYETAYTLKKLIEENQLDKFLMGNSSEKSLERLGEHIDLKESSTNNGLANQFAVFKHMPEFMEVLDGIVNLQCKTTCQEAGGCSISGDTHECNALKCIKSKGYDGCWQCNDFKKCDKLNFLKRGYGYVIEENLTNIKEKGFDAVKSHGNKYYAWQRRDDNKG